MRSAARRRRAESDEESVFISMTDMTVSFLFIVMILLAFFASQFRPDEMVPKIELEEAVRNLEKARITILDKNAEIARHQDEIDYLLSILKNSVPKAELEKAERQLSEASLSLSEKATEIARLKTEIDALQLRLDLIEVREINLVEEYAKAADTARMRIVSELQLKVQEAIPEIEVSVSEAGDILRFSGDSFFATGSSRIVKPRIRAVVHALAEGLEELLPCFTLGERSAWAEYCNPDLVLVDAVQIEGHTDSVGFPENNLRLSLSRGAATYLEAQGHRPGLLDYLNLAEQPVLSVSGYGESRPIAPNDSEGRGLNRRIDLRLIMASVGDAEEIVQIRKRLEGLAESAWQGSKRK